VRISLFLITVKVVTARKEEVGGADTHEMDILGPLTSSASAESPPRSVSTGQDANDEAQSVVSQDQGVTSIWPCCRIPRRLFCSVTGSGGSDAPEVDQSRRNDDASAATSNRLTQAEAQIRAYLLTILKSQ
jgi:hypothetical protein